MQNVAREMNLSETAFLLPRSETFGLRWFTPQVEVALCGHATLAGAHVLWERGIVLPEKRITFYTLSGDLFAWQVPGDSTWIEMDFPSQAVEEVIAPEGMLRALGLSVAQIRFIGRNEFDYLVEVESEDIVRETTPLFFELIKTGARGVIVTARSSGEFDFVSRFFAPAVGINEDPVTGSAHCALAPYWAEKLGKRELLACQASARGGILRLRLEDDRVILGGQAVTVLCAELLVDFNH
jgi:PhzF family phenazine biosynthesis protein